MKIKEALRDAAPQLALLAVPFLVLVPLWDKFPARVPIHWGLSGAPNGWADKGWGLLLVPVMNVGLSLLFHFILRFDSRMRSYSPETQASMHRVVRGMGLATGIFTCALALMIDAIALGWNVDVGRIVTLGTLLLCAVLGNYMPKLRPNRFVGIRTPWTLKSPEAWTRTHRMFGSIMLVGSLVLIPPCAFLPSPWCLLLLTGYLVAVSAGATIYSYRCRTP